MNELKEKMKEVFKKYELSFNKKGIELNLETWAKNKGPLIELLRKHPNWNEDALAVIFESEYWREITYDELMQAVSNLEYLHPIFDYKTKTTVYAQNDYMLFYDALYSVVMPQQKLISRETAEAVKQYADIVCTAGEKCSKVINKICQKFAVDTHEKFGKVFAKLSDCVNPIAIKRKVVLSVHPCDYLEMSDKDNSWKSCHNLVDGEYAGGTLSYMNDSVSMILFSVEDQTDRNDFYKMKKINRQVFCYENSLLLQSRLYPNDTDHILIRTYAKIVKNAISECLQDENDWNGNLSVEDYCMTFAGSAH